MSRRDELLDLQRSLLAFTQIASSEGLTPSEGEIEVGGVGMGVEGPGGMQGGVHSLIHSFDGADAAHDVASQRTTGMVLAVLLGGRLCLRACMPALQCSLWFK